MQCLTEGCQRFSKIVKVNKNEASVSLTTALFIKHWPTMEGYCNLYERQSSSATQPTVLQSALASCMHHYRLFYWHLTNSSITDVTQVMRGHCPDDLLATSAISTRLHCCRLPSEEAAPISDAVAFWFTDG